MIAAKVLDLKPKHRRELPFNIRRLSHELTDERAQGFAPKYMSDAASLSAYVAFFLPWNLYRLTRLLSGLELDLPDNALCVDLGSGPLTAIQALWIAKPELRQRKLHFICLDRAAKPMRVGLELFHALAGQDTPWRIDLEQGALGARLPARADLLIAANVLNEFSTRTGEGREERMAQSLARQTAENARMLLVEPGTRTGGRLLSSLRTELAEEGFMPLAPCTHVAECPMPGTAGKAWCHFQFGVAGAPQWLQRMSEDVGFRRRGVALSFFYAGRGEVVRERADIPGVRMISDIFELTGAGLRAGRYGCAEAGLVIAAGDEHELKRLPSGCLWRPRHQPEEPLRDAKTGALILPLEPLPESRRTAHLKMHADANEETRIGSREEGKRTRAVHAPKPKKTPGIYKVRNMALQAFRAAQPEDRQAEEGGREPLGRPAKHKTGKFKPHKFKPGKSRSGKFKNDQFHSGKPVPKSRQDKPKEYVASGHAGQAEPSRETKSERHGGVKPRETAGHSERGYAARGQNEDRRHEKRGAGPFGGKPKRYGTSKPYPDRQESSAHGYGKPMGQKTSKVYEARDARPSERGGHSPVRESGRPERNDRRDSRYSDKRSDHRQDIRLKERNAKNRPDSGEREPRERDERDLRGSKPGRGPGRGGKGGGGR